MKTSVTRIIRRRKRASADSAFFKKESQEPGFFADTIHQTFFQPTVNTIQRTSNGPEEGEKLQRASDKKEEEKKLQRLPEKKEEKKLLQMKGDVINDDEKKLTHTGEKKEEDIKLQQSPEKKKEKLHEKNKDIRDKKEHLQKRKDENDRFLKKKDEKEKEEKKLQRKESGANLTVPSATASYVTTLNEKGMPLPEDSKKFFGSRMEHDFSDVKIHTGTDAERSAKEVNAKAYTIQNHIVFNEGQFDPDSNQGKKLLAHELAHVVQKDENN